MKKKTLKKKKTKKEKYLSLQEATKHCDYSQEYLSLRARQEKLKAVKIGRNWVTKKEWVKDYIKENGNGKKTNKKRKKKSIEIKPPENLPVEEKEKKPLVFEYKKEELKTKKAKRRRYFSVAKNWPAPEIKFSLPFVEHQPFSIEKFITVSPQRKLLSKVFVSAVVFLFFLSIMTGGIIFFEQANVKKSLEKAEKNYEIINEDFLLFVENINSKYIWVSTANTYKKYGKWLGASIKDSPQILKDKTAKLYQIIKSPFVKIYKFVFPSEEATKQLETGEIPEMTKEPEVKEGMVVTPSTDQDEEVKEKIKEVFSDEVEIKEQDNSSGIITPVFKEEDGEEYLYIMVPIKDQE